MLRKLKKELMRGIQMSNGNVELGDFDFDGLNEIRKKARKRDKTESLMEDL